MKLLIFWGLISVCYSQISEKKEIVCCECVPFFLCENGTIITDGTGVLDLRIGGEQTTPAPAKNVEVCPNPVDMCCLVPNADPSCLNQPTTTEQPDYNFTPPPESNCECIPYMSCDPDLVVSDGLGLTSIELSNGRMANHSKCTHALDACCWLPDIDITGIDNITPTPIPLVNGTTSSSCKDECVPPYLCGPDGYVITDGVGVIDLRIGPSSVPEPCPDKPNFVCCRLRETKTETSTELQETSSTSTELTTPTTLPPPIPPCGTRNFLGIGVI